MTTLPATHSYRKRSKQVWYDDEFPCSYVANDTRQRTIIHLHKYVCWCVYIEYSWASRTTQEYRMFAIWIAHRQTYTHTCHRTAAHILVLTLARAWSACGMYVCVGMFVLVECQKGWVSMVMRVCVHPKWLASHSVSQSEPLNASQSHCWMFCYWDGLSTPPPPFSSTTTSSAASTKRSHTQANTRSLAANKSKMTSFRILYSYAFHHNRTGIKVYMNFFNFFPLYSADESRNIGIEEEKKKKMGKK